MNATNRTRNGTMHAEFIAVNEILAPSPVRNPWDSEPREWTGKFVPEILKQCTLYVTVEPCIMCASLLRQFGIKKVFFGASNEKFGGTGGVLDIHLGNGRAEEDRKEEGKEDDYEVNGGWLREEAIVMLRRFYVQENERGELLFCVVGRLLMCE
jgi:tRNA-specific adenosine deaminase 2